MHLLKVAALGACWGRLPVGAPTVLLHCGEPAPARKVGLPPIPAQMQIQLTQIKPAAARRTYGAAMSSRRTRI